MAIKILAAIGIGTIGLLTIGQMSIDLLPAAASDRGSGRVEQSCRRPGDRHLGLPKCRLTTLPEADGNEDPDLTGQPGTPDRTQGSGTRAIDR